MDTDKVKKKYDSDIQNKYKDGYESGRWFSSEVQKASYYMTLDRIKNFAILINFNTCLELGPGHGTWTKELLATHKNAHFDLIDISSEMLKLVKERFKDRSNINYIEGDWLKYELNTKYDFFFSIRAVEYIPQKEKVVEKIMHSLKPQGEGFIITKTPKYLRNKILGRKISDFHSGQILPGKFKKLFFNNGAKNIELYPASLIFPMLRSVKMNNILNKLFGKKKLNIISQFFSESYCIKFTKK